MRVFVSGASGHVGGAIAAHLAHAGWDVVAHGRSPASIAAPCTIYQADLGSPAFAAEAAAALGRCDAIVHAAASLDKGLCAPSIALANCLGTQQVIQLARTWGAASLVFISSVPLIGLPVELPITEEHPARPLTAYHASKLFGEHLTAIAARDGLAGASLRLTAPVGPGTPPHRILSVFVAKALAGEPLALLGAGTREQNYVDVRDVARAVELAILRRATGVFNVAGRECISNRRLAELCISTLGSNSRVIHLDQQDPEEGIRWEVSLAKARDALGFEPACTLIDSIGAIATRHAARPH